MIPDYEQILKEYPKYMSLEQMRLVCHISKKTARLLLQNGFVPCKKTKKKTHTYKIKKTAIIEYLIQRGITPEKYRFGQDSYDVAFVKAIAEMELAADSDVTVADFDKPLQHEEHPDVLTTKQAASLAGVATSAINDWVKKKYLISFRKSGALYIPKISLLEYLESPRNKFNRVWKQSQFSKQAKNNSDCTFAPDASSIYNESIKGDA